MVTWSGRSRLLSWLSALGVGGENGLLPLLPEFAAGLELTLGPGLAGRLATGDLPGMGDGEAGPGWLPGLTGVTSWSAEGSWVGALAGPGCRQGPRLCGQCQSKCDTLAH